MLVYESMCLSEAPYMLLATISVLCLLKGTADVHAAKWWVFACRHRGRLCVVRPKRGDRPVSGLALLPGQPVAPASLPRAGNCGLRLAGRMVPCLGLADGTESVDIRTSESVPAPAARLWFWLTLWSPLIAVAAVVLARIALLAQTGRLDSRSSRRVPAGGVSALSRSRRCSGPLRVPAGGIGRQSRFYVPVYWIGLWLLVLCGRHLGARLPLRPRTAHAILAATLAVFAASQAVGPLLVTFLEQRAPSARQEPRSRAGTTWHCWRKESPRTGWSSAIACKSCKCSGT